MNPIISITSKDGIQVLVNVNNIASVWEQGNGITTVKMNTFVSANTHDIISTREGVVFINAKIQAAFKS